MPSEPRSLLRKLAATDPSESSDRLIALQDERDRYRAALHKIAELSSGDTYMPFGRALGHVRPGFEQAVVLASRDLFALHDDIDGMSDPAVRSSVSARAAIGAAYPIIVTALADYLRAHGEHPGWMGQGYNHAAALIESHFGGQGGACPRQEA